MRALRISLENSLQTLPHEITESSCLFFLNGAFHEALNQCPILHCICPLLAILLAQTRRLRCQLTTAVLFQIKANWLMKIGPPKRKDRRGRPCGGQLGPQSVGQSLTESAGPATADRAQRWSITPKYIACVRLASFFTI